MPVPTTPRDRKKSQEYWGRQVQEQGEFQKSLRGNGLKDLSEGLQIHAPRYPPSPGSRKSHGCPLLVPAAAAGPQAGGALLQSVAFANQASSPTPQLSPLPHR